MDSRDKIMINISNFKCIKRLTSYVQQDLITRYNKKKFKGPFFKLKHRIAMMMNDSMYKCAVILQKEEEEKLAKKDLERRQKERSKKLITKPKEQKSNSTIKRRK